MLKTVSVQDTAAPSVSSPEECRRVPELFSGTVLGIRRPGGLKGLTVRLWCELSKGHCNVDNGYTCQAGFERPVRQAPGKWAPGD